MQVLVAEDELISLKMLEHVLTSHGYDVVGVTNGTEALRLLECADAPKLAVLDWTIPGVDGVEICRRLRQRDTPTPPYLILLTAKSAKADVIAGLEAGANDFMTKPFDQDELRARVRVGQTVVDLQANVANRMREFQDYVESAPMGILVVGTDGRIVFANQSADQCFGYSHGELKGQVIENLVPLYLRDCHVVLRDQYGKKPRQVTLWGRRVVGCRKDGTEVSVAIGLNPVQQRTTAAVACAVRDLTDLRRAEQDLEQFFDLSPDLCSVAHVQGHIIRVNRQLQQLLGYTHEQLLSRPYLELVHPDDLPAARAAVQHLAAGQKLTELRLRLLDNNGQPHWTEWSARGVAEEGKIYAVARDVTARLQMEEELRMREQRERAILNNIPAVIYVKGTDGRYQYVNRRFAEILALQAEEIVGSAAEAVFPTEVADKIVETDQRAIDSRGSVTFQTTMRHDDGDHTYLAVKCPLFDQGGAVSGLASIWTDITEQIQSRKFADELKLAKIFQRKLYPSDLPQIRGLDMAGSSLAMTQLSGDYYDFAELDPDRLAIVIGDVSGHGLGPALEMAQVRTAWRLLQKANAGLWGTLTELNGMLCQDLPESTFVSLFMAEIDTQTGELRYLGAGHDAFLVRADGDVRSLEATDLFLGIDPCATFQGTATEVMAPGDILFVFTDGLSDTVNTAGQYLGRQRAIDAVIRHRAETADVSNRSRVDIARNRGFGYCCGWHGCSTDSIGRSVGIAAA